MDVQPHKMMRPRYRRTVTALDPPRLAPAYERRSAIRYALSLSLSYTIRERRIVRTGSGVLHDISSRSLRFTADTTRLRAPCTIQLSIQWPAQPADGPQNYLTVMGTVIQCSSRGIIVLIRRYAVGPIEESPSAEQPD